MQKRGKRQQEQGNSQLGWVYCVLKGSFLALAVVVVLLLACAAAVSGGWMSQAVMERCVTGICLTAAMLGTVVSMKGRREMALLLGVATGGMLFFLLLGLGMLLFQNAPVPEQIPTILCACLCGGTTTGILGRKTKKKRRR